MRPNPNDQLVDMVLLAGVVGLLLLQTVSRPEPPAAPAGPPKPGLMAIRQVEERGLVIDGSAELSAETNAAIDPEGRATSPRRILDDTRDALLKTPGTFAEQHLVWTAVAIGLHEDRIALEAIGELARSPDHLTRFGPTLDELNRLARGQTAHDIGTLAAFFRGLGATPWLEHRLQARQLANAGDAIASEAAVAQARAVADRFVSGQLTIIGIQFGLMLVGLVTFVVFPLFMRRRARTPGPLENAPSPFRLDRTRRVLIGWLLFTWVAQFALAQLRAALNSEHFGLATLQAIATVFNAVIAIALIRSWGKPDDANGARSSLVDDLRLGSRHFPGGLRGFLFWLVPAVGVAVVALQLSAVVSALIFGPPDTYQESVQLLMTGASDLDFFWVGLGAVLIAPIAEEILFRGFLYRNMRDSMGRPIAILVSGLIFGVIHMHPQFIIPLAGLGAALAILYEWTGSLWVPIIAHAAWNGITLAQVHVTFNF